MSLSIQDKNLLQSENENLLSQNTDLSNGNNDAFNATADLYPLDIPFKKIVDDIHSDIFFYEDELKYLDGHEIVDALQEETFVIYDTVDDARIRIRDGRLKITENNQQVVNIPIIPIKGYSQSRTNIGNDFDIWSRDRHGSTTSEVLSSPNIIIDDCHRKLKVKMDGYEQEVDVADILALPIQMTGLQLSSIIQNLFQQIESGSTLNTILAPYFEVNIGDTMYLQVNGGYLQPATFSADGFALVFGQQIMATAKECVDFFNKHWSGVTVALNGTQIQISISSGYFQISNGYGNPNNKFGFSMKRIIYQSPFTSASCVYNDNLNIFTIASGSGGSSSTAEVLQANPLIESMTFTNKADATLFQLNHFPVLINTYSVYKNSVLLSDHIDYSIVLASGILELVVPLVATDTLQIMYGYTSDLRNIIGFDDLNQQYKIQGKYQNNLLTVKMGNQTETIQIKDFRRCFHSVTLGDDNDDYGVLWSGFGNTLSGPLLCSGFDDAADVAASIQAKLREVGSGGFTNAVCKYYSYSQQFIIYSGVVCRHGMVGLISSVHILPGPDPLRDARTMLGFDIPVEEEFTNAFDTLGSLYDELNQKTGVYQNVIVAEIDSRANWDSRLSHSILYSSDTGYLVGTGFQAYSFPTTKIYDDGSRSKPRIYPNGKVVIDSTNNKINYTQIANVEKTVTIVSGEYPPSSSEDSIGLDTAISNAFAGSGITCTYNFTAKQFTLSGLGTILFGTGKDTKYSMADRLGFNSTDHILPCTSDYQTQITNSNPFTMVFPKQFFPIGDIIDLTINEKSLMFLERYYAQSENVDSNLLSQVLSLSQYDNEILLDGWESLANTEFTKVSQVISAIRHQRGAYANHISETGPEINRKTIAYESAAQNWNSLNDLLQNHAGLLNIKKETETVSGTTFMIASHTGKLIYNNPPPLVNVNGGRHITGTFSNPEFFTTSNTYTVDSSASAKLISRMSSPFRLSDGDDLTINIDSDQPVSMRASLIAGYCLSGTNAVTKITSNTNDRLLINIDNIAMTMIDDPVTILSTIPYILIPPEVIITVQTQHPLLVLGTSSGRITHLVGPDTVLVENVDYTITDWEQGIITFLPRLPLSLGDVILISYQYQALHEIILGTQINGYDIAAKIQQEVRNIYINNITDRASFLGFTCSFNETNISYALVSGSGGTNSSVKVYSDGVNDAAVSLKIGRKNGVSNGGSAVAGSGIFSNSNSISIADLTTWMNLYINVFSGTTNVIITSTSKIQVRGLLATKLGFDAGINDLSIYPAAPVDYSNVTVQFYTIDFSNVANRIVDSSHRLTFDFNTRSTQINTRVNEILPLLTDSLYEPRRDNLPLRLDYKLGSYKKIGNLLNSIDNNNATQAQNSAQSSNLDALINA
jgi:hypothetical protein